jgi:hypothetical protein
MSPQVLLRRVRAVNARNCAYRLSNGIDNYADTFLPVPLLPGNVSSIIVVYREKNKKRARTFTMN